MLLRLRHPDRRPPYRRMSGTWTAKPSAECCLCLSIGSRTSSQYRFLCWFSVYRSFRFPLRIKKRNAGVILLCNLSISSIIKTECILPKTCRILPCIHILLYNACKCSEQPEAYYRRKLPRHEKDLCVTNQSPSQSKLHWRARYPFRILQILKNTVLHVLPDGYRHKNHFPGEGRKENPDRRISFCPDRFQKCLTKFRLSS